MGCLSHSVVKDATAFLSNPINWNHSGGFHPESHCIVTAVFHECVKRSTGRDVSRRPALDTITQVIIDLYGAERMGNEGIIGFNDHPDTTHADIMRVMNEAERRLRPFWTRLFG